MQQLWSGCAAAVRWLCGGRVGACTLTVHLPGILKLMCGLISAAELELNTAGQAASCFFILAHEPSFAAAGILVSRSSGMWTVPLAAVKVPSHCQFSVYSALLPAHLVVVVVIVVVVIIVIVVIFVVVVVVHIVVVVVIIVVVVAVVIAVVVIVVVVVVVFTL